MAKKRADKKKRMEEKARELIEKQANGNLADSNGKSELEKMLGFDGTADI